MITTHLRRLGCVAVVVLLAACAAADKGMSPIVALDALVMLWASPTGGGHGSGVVVDEDLVLTAAHVAVHLPPSGTAVFRDGREAPVTVLRQAYANNNGAPDIALLAVDTGDQEPVEVRCTPVEPGEPLLVVGHPVAARWAVGWGTVSSVEALERDDRSPIGTAGDYYLADLPIAAGSSGGPVFDIDGQLVGIVTAQLNQPGSQVGFITTAQSTTLAIVQSPRTICGFLDEVA